MQFNNGNLVWALHEASGEFVSITGSGEVFNEKQGIMIKYCFTGQLKVLIDKAESGTAEDIDFLMSNLSDESNLAETKFVDFALGLATSSDGFEKIKHYLFNGILIQSNYASLYFNRLGEWKCVKSSTLNEY